MPEHRIEEPPRPGRVWLRPVRLDDLTVFYEQQRDRASVEMAAVRSRDRSEFDAHWAGILADETVVLRTVVADGVVAGHVTSFVQQERRVVGYWVGRELWGRGVATAALRQLLKLVTDRPLWARVAPHNAASLRVLEKCGFRVTGEAESGLLLLQVGEPPERIGAV